MTFDNTAFAPQPPAPKKSRRGVWLVLGASVAGLLLFVVGAGTSGLVAINAQHTAQSDYQAAKQKALKLYNDDKADQTALDQAWGQMDTLRLALRKFQALADSGPWVSAQTQSDLSEAPDELNTGAAGGDAVPNPRPKDTSGMFITDVTAETHRLTVFVHQYTADHDQTKAALASVESGIKDVAHAAQELVRDGLAASTTVPTS